MCESDTMIFGEADGGGELPETPGYAAAEFADRARGVEDVCSPILMGLRYPGAGPDRAGRDGRGGGVGEDASGTD